MHSVAYATGGITIVLLASLAACFSKPPRPDDVAGDAKAPDDSQTAEGWLDGYQYRKHVTVTTGLGAPLINFPVGVSRSDPDIADHARSEGRDLVATAADGKTMLATELAAYDNGTFELWVRLEELGASGAFYLYYGGDARAPTTSVWDGPVFAGVWHLSEPGNARDSTQQANQLTAAGTGIPASFADGVFGPARQLDGTDDSLDGGDPPDGSLDFGTNSFGYSLWVHQSQLLGSFDTPFYKGGTSTQEPGYCWLLGTIWTAKITDTDGSFSDVELGLAAGFQNDWVHLAAVVDRQAGTFSAYANGEPTGEPQSLATRAIDNLSTTEPVQLSRSDQARFKGRLDEVRVYRSAPTADWIKTEFRNAGDPGFLVFGPEEEEP